MPEPSWITGALQLGAAGVGLLTLWIMIQYSMILAKENKETIKELTASHKAVVDELTRDAREGRESMMMMNTANVAVQREMALQISAIVKESALQRQQCSDRGCENYNPKNVSDKPDMPMRKPR